MSITNVSSTRQMVIDGLLDIENPFKGPRSYEEQDLNTFYGREEEVAKLFQLIRIDVLSIVYSKSGIGKSSLLKAGLMPTLRSNDYLPIYIRPDYSNKALNLREFIVSQIAVSIERMNKVSNGGYKFYEPTDNETLFEYFHRNPFYKNISIEKDFSNEEEIESKVKILKPVLIFDQFEEIFTIGATNEHVHNFIADDLACLIEKKTPPSVINKLEGAPDGEGKLLQFQSTQKNYSIVFSFREEYFSNLEALADNIPSVFYSNSRVRLTAFNADVAKEIILRTSQFTIPADVIESLIKIITGGKSHAAKAKKDIEVEPFLLSLICFQLYPGIASNDEKTIERIKGTDSLLVDEILKDYYESSLKEMPETVRVFVEEELLTDKGNRTLHAVDDAEAKLGSGYTDRLVNEYRLLRKEEFLDSQHLEIIHDRLTPVILKSRNERRARETDAQLRAKLEEQKKKQEEEHEKEQLEFEKRNAEKLRLKAEEQRQQIQEDAKRQIEEAIIITRQTLGDQFERDLETLRQQHAISKQQIEEEKKTAVDNALQASEVARESLLEKLKRAENDFYRELDNKEKAQQEAIEYRQKSYNIRFLEAEVQQTKEQNKYLDGRTTQLRRRNNITMLVLIVLSTLSVTIVAMSFFTYNSNVQDKKVLVDTIRNLNIRYESMQQQYLAVSGAYNRAINATGTPQDSLLQLQLAALNRDGANKNDLLDSLKSVTNSKNSDIIYYKNHWYTTTDSLNLAYNKLEILNNTLDKITDSLAVFEDKASKLEDAVKQLPYDVVQTSHKDVDKLYSYIGSYSTAVGADCKELKYRIGQLSRNVQKEKNGR